MTRLGTLLRPPPRLFSHRRDGVVPPSAARGRIWWILSRGLCRHHLLTLPEGTPERAGRLALDLAIQRVSPFVKTGSYLHRFPHAACAWLWDEDNAFAAVEAAGLDPKRVRFLPESILAAPGEFGPRLIETMDGVEAQFWRDGFLAASRWWPHPPDEAAWHRFQRGAGVAPEFFLAAIPPIRKAAWQDRPWTDRRAGISLIARDLDPRWIRIAAAFPIVAALSFQAGRILHLEREAMALEREILAKTEAVGPVLEAKGKALDNLAAIRALRAQDPYPGQLGLMAAVARLLPAGETRFTAWSFDRGRLEVTLAADRPLDTLSYVRRFEAAPGFREVAVERTGAGNAIRVKASVAAK